MLNTFRRSGHLSSTMRVSVASMMHTREWSPQFFWRTKKKMLKEEREFLSEAGPTNSTGSGVANFDPVLISLIRRAMPNLVAYDLAGVQPMNGPTGLIFAMRSRYSSQSGTEALFDEADTAFANSGISTSGPIHLVPMVLTVGLGTDWWCCSTDPSALNPSSYCNSDCIWCWSGYGHRTVRRTGCS